MVIQFIEHHAERASCIGGKFQIILSGALRPDRFKDLNDIEQRESLRIDGKPITSANAASGLNDPCAPKVPQHFCQMMSRNAVFVSDFCS